MEIIAQILPINNWGLGQWLIAILVACGMIAIAIIILRQLQIMPPPWFINICWVIALVFVGGIAIHLLMRMF